MHRKLASPRTIARSRAIVVLTAGMLAALTLAAGAVPASGADPQNGFKTKQPAMLAVGPGAPLGTEIKPILTVGDTIGGYRYESIPDGISYLPSGKNEATVFVNHETSTVPFPFAGTPTPANSQNDFDNSQLSRLTIRNGGAILGASLIIPSIANYQRFCSETLGTLAAGFSRPILFNNEEGIDWVKKTGTAFPATEGAADAREIGAVVASDVSVPGAPYTTIWGMGRFNHENNVAVPGYGKPVTPVRRRLIRHQQGPVAGLRLHRQLRRCRAGRTRASCTRSCRMRQGSTITTISRGARPPASAATSSRSRR